MYNKIFSYDISFSRKSILNIKRINFKRSTDLINKLKHQNMLEIVNRNLLQRTELCIRQGIFNNL